MSHPFKVIVMNPAAKKTVAAKKKKKAVAKKRAANPKKKITVAKAANSIGGISMAKKRHKKRAANPPKAKRRRRRNPSTPKVTYITKYRTRNAKRKRVRRRRNPASARNIMGKGLSGLKNALPIVLAVTGGMVGVRYAATKFFPNQTGWMKAGIMAGISVAVGMLVPMIAKGAKGKQIADNLMIGGLVTATLQGVDAATNGSQRGLYNLSGLGTVNNYIPVSQLRGGYGRLADSYYATPAGLDMAAANTGTWGRTF